MSNIDETAAMRARAEAHGFTRYPHVGYTAAQVSDAVSFATAEVARALAEMSAEEFYSLSIAKAAASVNAKDAISSGATVGPLAFTGMASAGPPVCQDWCGRSPWLCSTSKHACYSKLGRPCACSDACAAVGRPLNPAPNLSPGVPAPATTGPTAVTRLSVTIDPVTGEPLFIPVGPGPEGAPAAPAVPAPWSGVTCSSCRGLSGRHEVFCSSIAARLISACNQHGALAIARQVAPLIREVTAVESELVDARNAWNEAMSRASAVKFERSAVEAESDALKARIAEMSEAAKVNAGLMAAALDRGQALQNRVADLEAEKAAAVLVERSRGSAWFTWWTNGSPTMERLIRYEQGIARGEAAPR